VSSHRTRLNPDLVGCGLLAVMIGLLFWNRATFDIWIARRDNLTAYLPSRSYLGQRLAAGQILGWNPHQFSGIPFLADPQSGWMHLPPLPGGCMIVAPGSADLSAPVQFQIRQEWTKWSLTLNDHHVSFVQPQRSH